MSARVDQLAARLDRDIAQRNVWPQPQPLPSGLPAVPALEAEMLPEPLRSRAVDIHERLQCPLDYPAVALLSVLSVLCGRKLGIRPKRQDDWIVVPNLWGAIVGRPGVMKSPALKEAMLPLMELERVAAEEHEFALRVYEEDTLIGKAKRRNAEDALRKALKDGGDARRVAQEATSADEEPPVCRRYVVNDTTVEKLGELLRGNPNGVMVFRDELVGWLRNLDKQGHESDRAFYLEAWNGDGGFTYDRIGRGTVRIEAACISVLGGIQPGPLGEYIRGLKGSGDDGLLQRFQLMVWPDVSPVWRNIDRAPVLLSRQAVSELVDAVRDLDAARLGAEPGPIPSLRFDPAAQEIFDRWRADLEQRLRSGELAPQLESHLAKFRSLVPALALLFHLTTRSAGPVGLVSLELALAWADYLEQHAGRVYAQAVNPAMDAARTLARHVQAKHLESPFSLRDVYRPQWSGLTSTDEARAAVGVLCDFDWCRPVEPMAGRGTRELFEINPRVKEHAP